MAEYVVNGAFVGFKTGLQSKVDQMLSDHVTYPAEHGCFYLTQDSHRLYVGNEDHTLSPVNEGIQTLTWSELQTEATRLSTAGAEARKAATGRFYYASDRNILCVYNGTNFVQLNENTNTYVKAHGMSVSTTAGVSTVQSRITNTDGTTDTNLDATFTVTGANGITVSGTGTALTITGDTYTLGHAAGASNVGAKITLDSTANDSEVSLIPGDNVTIESGANGITIGAADTKNTELAIKSLKAGDTEGTQGFNVAVTETGGHKVQASVDPTVAWYTNASGNDTTSAHFVNGQAVLDVYSRAAIDSKLQAVNAMTYRGTVGTNGTGATSITYNNGNTSILDGETAVPVSIGDTFLALQDGTYNGIAYQKGSLFIVRAKEGASEQADGTLAANDVICDVVAETSNVDTQYILTPAANDALGVSLKEKTGGVQGSLIFASDAWTTLTRNTTNVTTNNDTTTITVGHADVTRTNTTGTAVSQSKLSDQVIPVITSVTTDAKGHITGVETTQYTVTDSNASLDKLEVTTAAASNVGTVTLTGQLKNGNGGLGTAKVASMTLSSSSLTITDADNGGTSGSVPEGLAINMVWGSF